MSSYPPSRTRRGSSSLDAAIVMPALLVFLLVIIAGARIAMAQQAVTVAAQAAARAASLERSGPEAVRAGDVAAHASLADAVACQPDVTVTGKWDLPIGTPGTATATVTCRVKLSDLAIPGLPGEVVIVRTADSPIDRYRARAGG